MRKKIYNLHSDKAQPPRFCDAVREPDGRVYLEVKHKKAKTISRILWQDVQCQMEDFAEANDKTSA